MRTLPSQIRIGTDFQEARATYADVYQAARELGYSELEAMAYATEPDLFVADHPDVPVET